MRFVRQAILSISSVLFALVVLAPPSAAVENASIEPELSRRIVFVCHITDKDAMPALKNEVTKAIRALRPIVSFNVIVFDANGQPAQVVKDEALLTANPDNKLKAYKFIESITPTTNTDPTPLLATALGSGATLVQFVTDATSLHKDFTAKKVTELNARKVKINTLLFKYFSNELEALLKKLADDVGGRFTYIQIGETK